jgi:hypothetical protein
MKNIIVLNSSLPEGSYQIEANKSYLDKEFFESFKALEDAEEKRDETTGEKLELDLKSVSISFMRTSWICAHDEMKFLKNLTEEGPIHLFGNTNITQIVDYLWDSIFEFMWSHIFLPFVFLNFLPVLLLTVINFWLIDHHEFSGLLLLIYTILVILLTYGNLRSVYWEVKEVLQRGFTEYATDMQNYFQFGLIISTVSVTLSSYRVALNVSIRNQSEDPN